jgi:branched-chain amino acid transport system substrate-binding protein
MDKLASSRTTESGLRVADDALSLIAKTPLVGGQWRLRDGSKYEIVITDNNTAPMIPAGGKMEPIG